MSWSRHRSSCPFPRSSARRAESTSAGIRRPGRARALCAAARGWLVACRARPPAWPSSGSRRIRTEPAAVRCGLRMRPVHHRLRGQPEPEPRPPRRAVPAARTREHHRAATPRTLRPAPVSLRFSSSSRVSRKTGLKHGGPLRENGDHGVQLAFRKPRTPRPPSTSCSVPSSSSPCPLVLLRALVRAASVRRSRSELEANLQLHRARIARAVHGTETGPVRREPRLVERPVREYCGFVTVWFVGLVMLTVVDRPFHMTAFGALKTSARICSDRVPPRRMVRAIARSSVRLLHPRGRTGQTRAPRCRASVR